MKRTSSWKGITTISHNGFATYAEAKRRASERPLTRNENRDFIRILANRMLTESMKPKQSSQPTQPSRTEQLVGFYALGGVQ
jgi:hypothetical protein